MTDLEIQEQAENNSADYLKEIIETVDRSYESAEIDFYNGFIQGVKWLQVRRCI